MKFTTYYYDLNNQSSQITKEEMGNILSEKSKGSIEGYKIQDLGGGKFFIIFAMEHSFKVIPDKGKKDNLDIDNLSPLGLEDGEGLFDRMYAFLDINQNDIFHGSLGIINMLKTGKESTTLLEKFFVELFLGKKAVLITPCIYCKKEEYLKNAQKIESFSILLSSPKAQQTLGVVGEIGHILNFKDSFSGDSIEITVRSNDGLKKDIISSFTRKNSAFLNKSPKIKIENAGKHVEQQLDKIRFKSEVELESNNFSLENSEVLSKMELDYNTIVPQIREDSII